MFASTAAFFVASQPFVATFNDWAGKMSPAATADHLCYHCSSAAEFAHIRQLFESESGYIFQSIISKRRIAIVKFARPLATVLGDIWFLELSDQKPDGSQTSRFDHIEIYPRSGSMDQLVAELESRGCGFTKVVRPHHTTYDACIDGKFKVRLEPEALIGKIMCDEMR